MKFYVFEDAFGIMAPSEEVARQAAHEQWSEHFVGEFNRESAILCVMEPLRLVPFFA